MAAHDITASAGDQSSDLKKFNWNSILIVDKQVPEIWEGRERVNCEHMG